MPAQQLGQPLGQPVDLLAADGDEILVVDLPRIGRLDPRDDHLQLAVIDLRRAGDAEIVARLDRIEHVVAGVPEHAGQRAGFVGQPQLQIQIAIAIGAELLIGDQEHLIDVFAFAELIDEAAECGHKCCSSRGQTGPGEYAAEFESPQGNADATTFFVFAARLSAADACRP